ncbi:hypothetical protein D3C72_1495910 [compost metagenome]
MRRHHDHEGIRREPVRGEVRLALRNRANTEIDLARADHARHLVLGHIVQFHLHARMPDAELADKARQHQRRLDRRRRNRHPPPAQRAQFVGVFQHAVDVGHGLLDRRQQLGAGLGDLHEARVAVEQLEAQVAFQFVDQRAD